MGMGGGMLRGEDVMNGKGGLWGGVFGGKRVEGMGL